MANRATLWVSFAPKLAADFTKKLTSSVTREAQQSGKMAGETLTKSMKAAVQPVHVDVLVDKKALAGLEKQLASLKKTKSLNMEILAKFDSEKVNKEIFELKQKLADASKALKINPTLEGEKLAAELRSELSVLEKDRRNYLKVHSTFDAAEMQKEITAAERKVEAKRVVIREKMVMSGGAMSEAPAIDKVATNKFYSGMQAAGAKGSHLFGKAFSAGLAIAGVSFAAFAVKGIKNAGDFQQAIILLQTAGGELHKNLGMIASGIQSVAVETGTSTTQLTSGMYTIEKAGIRGATGLKVLKAAAEGARAEGADLGVMTNALTSIMASYGKSMSNPIKTTNELVAAAGASKTNMQTFADSLSTVQPIAAKAGINFAELGGAISTLTSHGTSAHEATLELANTIRNLQAPNNVAAKEMAQFGINAQDLSTKLGSRGLQKTVELLSNTVLKKMGPSGKIMLGTFNQSKIAAKDAEVMFSKLPKSVADMASGVKDGTLTLGDWRKELKDLTPANASLASQWLSSYNKSKQFNDQLRAGTPEARTYISSLKKMTGGATGLNTVLQLTGESSDHFTKATKKIADAGAGANKKVTAWEEDQKTFNVQISRFAQGLDVAGIKIGTVLLPGLIHLGGYLQKTVLPVFKMLYDDGIKPVFDFLEKHKTTFDILKKSVLAFVGVWALLTLATKAQTLATKISGVALKLWAAITYIATGAQIAFNMAMDANPITLVILAIIALGVAFVVAYKKSATFRAIVQGALHGIESAAKAVANFFVKTIPAAFEAVINYVKQHWRGIAQIVLIALAPLGVIPALIWKYFGPIKSIVMAVFNAVKSAVLTATHAIVSAVQAMWPVLKTIGTVIYAILALPFVLAFDAIEYVVKKVIGWVGPYVMIALNAMAAFFKVIGSALHSAWSATWNAIKAVIKAIWGFIGPYVMLEYNRMVSGFKVIGSALHKAWSATWNAISGAAKAVWRALSGWFSAAWLSFRAMSSASWHKISGAVSAAWGAVTKPVKAVWKHLHDDLSHAFDAFKVLAASKWKSIAGAISGAFKAVGKGVSSVWGTIKGFFVKGINDVIGILNKFIHLLNKVPGVHLGDIGTISVGKKAPKDSGGGTGGLSRTRGIAKGGVLPGYLPGRDTIRAMLSPGEGILVPEAVRGLGPSFVHAANAHFSKGRSGKKGANADQHFSFGGIVGDMGKFGSWAGSKLEKGAEAVNPMHIIDKAFDAAVSGAFKVANSAANHIPTSFGKDLGHGILNTIRTDILHDGHADAKKLDMSGLSGSSVLSYAAKFLGTPYVWGGAEPGGFDCSGLVQYVLKHFGVNAPRTAAQQQAWTTGEPKSAARPGDEIFWGNPAHHTAFYMGGNRMLEAPHTGDVVKYANLYGNPTFGRAPGSAMAKLLGGITGGPGGGSNSSNRTLGMKIAKSMGYGNEFSAIDYVASHESGWNNKAQNPNSTAYGIGQFLNGTWAGFPGGKTSNPTLQITDMIQYMVSRYGSPTGAMEFWKAHHNYGKGGIVGNMPATHDRGLLSGWLQPGQAGMNKTGHPEAILKPRQLSTLMTAATHNGQPFDYERQAEANARALDGLELKLGKGSDVAVAKMNISGSRRLPKN